ncbi:MAG: hypothetical protein QOE86_1196 [Solirubrobacteraceae bacterium]|jgi:hypothetical protein|nr:hypothetical protein [Solirubrobacteraceae bacterium]
MTRRRALAAAVAAPVAARAARAGAAGLTGDAAVLQPIHRDEMFALAAYRAAAVSPSARVREIAVRFRRHEAQHVAALATSLEALGAPRFAPPGGAAGLDREAQRLGIAPLFSEVRTPDELLGFLLAVEQRLIADWVRAHGGLGDANLIQAATQVLACQGEHVTVLRRALGRDPLPHAFETGAT